MQDIEGIVINQQNQPVVDATISIIRATAPVADIGIMTNDDGRFFIDDLQNGHYTVRVFYGNDQTRDYDFMVPLDNEIMVIRVVER
ncbi:MAG: carboxypeptidase-like regulatory domain-containing protein [Bacteroidota bacterium]